MTKGKALIKARRILGPRGHVGIVDGVCVVGKFVDEFVSYGSGLSWEEALKSAAEVDEFLGPDFGCSSGVKF